MKKKHTKKQKIIAIVALVAVAIALVLFIVIGIPMIKDYKNSGYNSKYVYDDVSLVGVWQEKDFENNTYKIYDFRNDKKVIVSLYVCGIEAIRDELSTYRTEDKNTLIITYTVNGNPINGEYKFSISDDKSTLVLREGTKNIVLEKYNLEYNEDTSIFGTWDSTEREGVSYTFNEDYSGITTEGEKKNNILFSTQGDKFNLFINENLPIDGYTLKEDFVVEYKYEIENDTLTLKGSDGKVSTYQRRK